MNIADQIIEAVGERALAAVSATDIREYDDIDTPGVQFEAVVGERAVRVVITQQPTGAYKVYVFDPTRLETLRDEPDVSDLELAETISGLEQAL